MSRYLITHSLLSAWLYLYKPNPYEDATTEDDPMKDFLQTLLRQPTETTEAMQKGIDFENTVTGILEGYSAPDEDYHDAALLVANIIAGGRLQYKASKEIEVAGKRILLYGRLDALKAGTIYDIKFSKKYERGKYIDSTQHPIYMELVPEAEQFSYIVSNGLEVWSETYHRDEAKDIRPVIADFLEWLESRGLMGVYEEKWLAN